MQAALRMPASELKELSKRYNYGADPKLVHIQEAAKAQGYITRDQLYEIALWKSKRRASLVKNNADYFVQEITNFSFQAKHEHSRIGALSLLEGVQFPTASVILHFCVDEAYPILDFRAIWSLGLVQPSFYTPNYWVEYTSICRMLAKTYELTVRELDMALWQFSKENQRP